jgi:UDP-N-acetylmuramoyl-tripeptide--D-alanyl-D-alanine ligase
MTALTAEEIAARSGGIVVGDAQAQATSWAFDSRSLDEGACFVALRGDRDGHDFVHAALDAGAHIALVDHEPTPPRPEQRGRALVRVDDTLAALQGVARTVRADRADARVVAVAGSTGKTSTKDLLAATLAPMGCHANAASYNNEFGLPITLCNTPATARVIVTEMGERVAGDLALLCDIARPDVAVITNAGIAHAEHLGGLDGTISVLRELIAAIPETGVVVVNADDPSTARLVASARADVVTVGTAASANVAISDVRVDDRLHSSFVLDGHRFSVPLHGAHQAANAALAVTVAHRVFGISYDEITELLGAVARGRWRMELEETADGVTILNDAYNANPDSMRAALDALAHLPVKGRRIAVLGDMRELGVHHDDSHADLGRRIDPAGVDIIVGVGAGGAAIVDAAGEIVARHRATDADDARQIVASIVEPGDAVLVKGSRALGLERVAEALLNRPDGRA